MKNNSGFSADLYRYLGAGGVDVRVLWRERTQLAYLRRFRLAQEAKSPLAQLFNRVLLERASRRTFIQIPSSCKVGAGLRLGHLGPVIINANATVGANCNIASGVTIGATNRGSRRGAPVLKDRVWVGTNAVIVGKVTIGTNVLIAPNAYVNFDVPDNSVVVGNPGVIRPDPDATAGYLENKIVERR